MDWGGHMHGGGLDMHLSTHGNGGKLEWKNVWGIFRAKGDSKGELRILYTSE